MTTHWRPVDGASGAVLLFLVLLVPPVKQALEASMTAQMLVQIPLLVAVGVLLAWALPKRLSALADEWNLGGISGLVLVTIASAFWMLPRALDASVTDPLIASAKYLSVPLLIGLPIALSWPRMGFIIKGVFLLEFIATLFRLGWLYRIAPDRLCSLYLLDDQQRLGDYLMLLGAAVALVVAWKLIWGRFTVQSKTSFVRSQ